MAKSEILRLSKSIFHTSKNGRHLFLNPEVPDWIVTNSNAAFIVGLIDGVKTLDRIAHELGQIDPDYDPQEFDLLFASLKGHGILEVPAQSPRIHEHSSRYPLHLIHLKFTDNCNLNCGYCYSGSGGCKKPFLESDLLDKILAEASRIASHPTFTVSGGEPLLHEKAMEFLQRINSAGNEVHLLTNGTRVTDTNARIIADTCSFVKISIDGPNEDLNSMTRGRGAFERAIRGVSLLEDCGVHVAVSMTVTKSNIHSLPEMAQQFGNKLNVQPFFRTGRGVQRTDFVISGQEYYDAMARIEGFQPMGGIDRHLEKIRGRGTTKCAMGDGEISISESGDVYPCQLLANPEFKGGNLSEKSLLEIMESTPFERARSFSSLKNEGCSDCPIRLLCGGACRARAYLETGDLFKNSDFCEYEKLAIFNGLFDNSRF